MQGAKQRLKITLYHCRLGKLLDFLDGVQLPGPVELRIHKEWNAHDCHRIGVADGPFYIHWDLLDKGWGTTYPISIHNVAPCEYFYSSVYLPGFGLVFVERHEVSINADDTVQFRPHYTLLGA